MVNPVALISRKRDGGELSEHELRDFVQGYLAEDGSVMEGQMGAFLMAGVLKGFSVGEAEALTRVLLESGDRMNLSGLRGPTVDKHSTGGVGDGTTLIVVPLLAAAGAQVVKLSGRGLGHTGGTLDKLESIPGFQIALSIERILQLGEENGCVIAAQTDRLVPADRALYALRDVTGTVSSLALIASSVMSKKLASGAETIVLDVKAGEGGLLGSVERAVDLARLCVNIGVSSGRKTSALITDMSTPLGSGIGNSLEVVEAVHQLRDGPSGRLGEVSLELATLALQESMALSRDEARARVLAHWNDGTGLETFRRMIIGQGGDPRVCDEPEAVLPRAPVTFDVVADAEGVIGRLPALAVGELTVELGAGRQRKSDVIDPSVGVQLRVAEGDSVERGQPLATIHARNQGEAERAAKRLTELVKISLIGHPAPTVLSRVPKHGQH